MPELPEVEAARSIIAKKCEGKTIQKVEIPDEDEKVFAGSSAAELLAALQGRRLESVGRKGKQLWLKLDGDKPMPLIHFGMTGFIAVKESSGALHVVAYENAPKDTASSWPPRFLKLLLHFGPDQGSQAADICQLAFCDARRFGRVKLTAGDPSQSDTVAKLGFDPLLELPELQQFGQLLAARGRRGARLKPLLLDQSFCAGVGNWVADEVLWQARLHPEQLVSALQPRHVELLYEALRQVVQTAVAADADSSRFPESWMFHVRWGKKAGHLAGHPLAHITVGSRTSCYVPALQKKVGDTDDDDDDGAAAARQKPAVKKRKAAAAAAKKQQKQLDDDDDGDSDDDDEGPEEEEQRPVRSNKVAAAQTAADGSKRAGRKRPRAAVTAAAAAAAVGSEEQQQEAKKKPGDSAAGKTAGDKTADGKRAARKTTAGKRATAAASSRPKGAAAARGALGPSRRAAAAAAKTAKAAGGAAAADA